MILQAKSQKISSLLFPPKERQQFTATFIPAAAFALVCLKRIYTNYDKLSPAKTEKAFEGS
jgi:hypothetical protein